MITHNHGSTGICGAAWYSASQFPADYQENLFICNPVTGRVHRDRLQWTGSTPNVDSQPDFISCDDGWFRPVDVKLGPDGALYIADFYNAVIGHYEVELAHPRRDREKGRILRVVYTGTASDKALPQAGSPNLKTATLPALIDALASLNLTLRTLATNEIVDRFGKQAVAPVTALLDPLTMPRPSPEQRADAIWILHRLVGLTLEQVQNLAHDESPRVRTHLLRALADSSDWPMPQRTLVQGLLNDPSPQVCRAAADALGRHPDASQLELLLSALRRCPNGDTHLKHTLRMAIRDHLAVDEIAAGLGNRLNASDQLLLAPLAIGVRKLGAEAISLLVESIPQETDGERRLAMSQHALRYIEREQVGQVIQQLATTTDLTLPAVRSWQASLQQRGDGADQELQPFAERLAVELLGQPATHPLRWTYETLDGKKPTESKFGIEVRRSTDGVAESQFHCTFPKGEQGTGIYRSEPFPLPVPFQLFVVGHDGVPEKPAQGKNVVRLIDAVTQAVLAEVAAPRSDIAVPVEWKLPNHASRAVFVEIIDRDANGTFAWIGAGRFSIDGLNPQFEDPFINGLALVSEFRLSALKDRVVARLEADETTLSEQGSCLQTLNALDPEPRLTALLTVLQGQTTSTELIDRLTLGVVSRDAAAIDAALEQTWRASTGTLQASLALELAATRPGATSLIKYIEQGIGSRRLLQEPKLQERLRSVGIEGINEKIASLTADLTPPSAELAKLLAERAPRVCPVHCQRSRRHRAGSLAHARPRTIQNHLCRLPSTRERRGEDRPATRWRRYPRCGSPL